MAILTTFKHTGDPEEMMRLADEKVRPIAQEAGAEHGQISSTIVRTEDGIMLVNLWESEAGMRRASERIGPVARASGLPPQEDWRMYEVILHAAPASDGAVTPA
jgi:Ni,Fe-hydrogenase III large subunit